MVKGCIEPQPIEYYKGAKGVLASYFETKYVMGHKQEFGGSEGLLDPDLPTLHADFVSLLCEE